MSHFGVLRHFPHIPEANGQYIDRLAGRAVVLCHLGRAGAGVPGVGPVGEAHPVGGRRL